MTNVEKKMETPLDLEEMVDEFEVFTIRIKKKNWVGHGTLDRNGGLVLYDYIIYYVDFFDMNYRFKMIVF